MRRWSILALAALLFGGMALPAQAAHTDRWYPLGSVDFSWRGERERAWAHFAGPVERLNFLAEGNGVTCRNVRATFDNGRTMHIFRGSIRRGRSVDVDLPGRDRGIRRLDFNCRSEGRREATIQIAADIGRYRGDWRRNPDWERNWARTFNWGDDDRGDNRGDRDDHRWDSDRWVRLGSESFEGRGDREVAYAGWSGRSIEALALKPVNGDARCSSVMATFGSGQTRPLNIDSGDNMRQGRFYLLDLPGGDRDVRRISMRCSPIRDMQVTIELYAQK